VLAVPAALEALAALAALAALPGPAALLGGTPPAEAVAPAAPARPGRCGRAEYGPRPPPPAADCEAARADGGTWWEDEGGWADGSTCEGAGVRIGTDESARIRFGTAGRPPVGGTSSSSSSTSSSSLVEVAAAVALAVAVASAVAVAYGVGPCHGGGTSADEGVATDELRRPDGGFDTDEVEAARAARVEACPRAEAREPTCGAGFIEEEPEEGLASRGRLPLIGLECCAPCSFLIAAASLAKTLKPPCAA
jgi:hypothetical protein